MNVTVCVPDGLVRQRNVLIAEIQNLKDDHELSINALGVTHQLSVQSLIEQHETKLESQRAAGQLVPCCFYVFLLVCFKIVLNVFRFFT